VEHNDVQRGKGIVITSNEKKKTFPTPKKDKRNVEGMVNMLGPHLQKFAQLSAVWQEFSSHNTTDIWQRSAKPFVFREENTHNKLSPKPIAINLA
jgi:hypothetical protein